jgi:hypothetical protein
MKKLLIVTIFICTTLFADTLQERFPNLSKSEIEHYKAKKELLPEIESEFLEFDSLSSEQKQEFKKKIKSLVPPIKSETKEYIAEYLVLFAPLMNYKSYILIDKFSDDKNSFYTARLRAKLLYIHFSKNVAYADTYLWGEVKAGNYKEPLKEYPKLLKRSGYDQDIQAHYDHLLKLVEFNSAKVVEKIKNIINNHLFTHTEFDKKMLLSELESIKTSEQSEFIQKANDIFKKYIQDEVSLFVQKRTDDEKPKNNTNLEWSMKDSVLYIKPEITLDAYNKIKELLKQNRYKKIVLDLKGNGGGILNGVVDIVNLFLPLSKKILTIKEKDESIDLKIYKSKAIDPTTPLEVHIDKKTARGAMYIAAILSKEKRAKVIGKSEKIDNSIYKVYPLKTTKDEYLLIKFKSGHTFDEDGKELEL